MAVCFLCRKLDLVRDHGGAKRNEHFTSTFKQFEKQNEGSRIMEWDWKDTNRNTESHMARS